MHRPGPLQELPLERFLSRNPNLPIPVSPSKSTRSGKRPLSPGGPTLFSPAKRRILNEEGVFSPEKTFKSPLLDFRAQAPSSPARFAHALRGPASPARKLDFGSPKNHAECSSRSIPSSATSESTPVRNPPSRLAPSPELVHSTIPLLKTPSTTPSTHGCEAQDIDDFFGSHPQPVITITPEHPLPTDPQSIHYPGFFVHRNTHILASPSHLTSSEEDSDSYSEREKKEGGKENVPPRRKARKAVTAPDPYDLKHSLLSPESKKRDIERYGKAKSTPATPKKRPGIIREGSTTPTPRRPSASLPWDILSPSPVKARFSLVQERRDRRRMFEDEADAAGSEDDETL